MHVVVPVKRLDQAKSRLASRLTATQRMRFAARMLEHVLSQLSGTMGVDRIVVLSNDPWAQALGRHFGCRALAEPNDRSGLNPALTFALQVLQREGVQRALILLADLPLIRRAEIEFLAARHARPSPDRSVVLIPDRRGEGTNGLICSLPLAFELQYGEGSFRRHLAGARARGLGVAVERSAGIALDIDDENDLALLVSALRFTRAGRRWWRNGSISAGSAAGCSPSTAGTLV